MAFLLAIDQGTTSCRAMVVGEGGQIVSIGQREHAQIFPHPGWVEHDAAEIWRNVRLAIGQALSQADVNYRDIAAVGITNQRETTVVWDRRTGEPICNAIVWQDTRTQAICDELASEGGAKRFAKQTGLPLATYFSAPKLRWMLDNVPGARARAEAGELAFGTTDAWVLWNLTGGVHGGVHATDVTNASRTMLLDLDTLTFSDELCQAFDIPPQMLPEVRPSLSTFGYGRAGGLLSGVPITGILGDQQAATFGQGCFLPGEAKNTYGTGSFVVVNTGQTPAFSDSLLTTVCYQKEGQAPIYALEGSIAVTGSLVQWLRDNLGFFAAAADVEALAASVADNGGVVIVPAFSGLFAPHWRPDARGAILGLTRYVTKAHLARAALESTCYQTRDVIAKVQAHLAAIGAPPLRELRADGGMCENSLLMQFQADMLDLDVVVGAEKESTALGAAFAAGLSCGFYSSYDEIRALWREGARYRPQMPAAERERLYRLWQKAVARSCDWVDDDVR